MCPAQDRAGDKPPRAKTIFCFGHSTAHPNRQGEHLKAAWICQRAEELKRRYPRMPGVAFYQHAAEDSPQFRDLIRQCDRLSADLWPDAQQKP